MSQYVEHPQIGSHVDLVPTFMDHLHLDPPLDPKLYSTGQSLLVKKSAQAEEESDGDDKTKNSAAADQRRALYFSARYFPEKNKINGIADAQYKWWFRVVGIDTRTRKMEIVPLKVTDANDATICASTEIRRAWDDGGSSSDGKEAFVKCKLDLFAEMARAYEQEFFQFLEIEHVDE